MADLVTYPEVAKTLKLPTGGRMMDKSLLQNEYKGILNFIKESSRVHPFFPVTLSEITYKDIDLGNG